MTRSANKTGLFGHCSRSVSELRLEVARQWRSRKAKNWKVKQIYEKFHIFQEQPWTVGGILKAPAILAFGWLGVEMGP